MIQSVALVMALGITANKSINRHGSRQHWSRLLTVALAGYSCSSSWL